MASILRAPAGSATAFAARTQTRHGPSRVLIVTSTRQVIGMPASDGRGVGVGAATPGGPAAPRVAGSRCPPVGMGAVEVHAHSFESSMAGLVDRIARKVLRTCDHERLETQLQLVSFPQHVEPL